MYTNSSFRTHNERIIVRQIIDESGLEGLKAALVATGVSVEEAEEWCEDPNAIPTELRRKLVKR